MHGLAVYEKERLLFARDLYLENYADSYICFPLPLLHSESLDFQSQIFLTITKTTKRKWFQRTAPSSNQIMTSMPLYNSDIYGSHDNCLRHMLIT